MRLIIDNEGRVNLPQPLRQQLQLEPGDSLEMETVGEQITLRPIRESGSLSREKGVWVFHTGHPLSVSTTDAILRQIRAERDSTNLDDREGKGFSTLQRWYRYSTGITSTTKAVLDA